MQWFDKKLRSRTLFNLDFVVNTKARCALRSYKCGCWGTENRSIKWLSRKSEYIGLCPEGIAGGGDRERQAFQDEAAFARILRNACWCHQEHHQPQHLGKNGFLLFTAQIIIKVLLWTSANAPIRQVGDLLSLSYLFDANENYDVEVKLNVIEKTGPSNLLRMSWSNVQLITAERHQNDLCGSIP